MVRRPLRRRHRDRPELGWDTSSMRIKICAQMGRFGVNELERWCGRAVDAKNPGQKTREWRRVSSPARRTEIESLDRRLVAPPFDANHSER